MKRYRVLRFSFDTRARLLADGILAEDERKHTCRGIVAQYGGANPERTLRDFIDFGSLPWSVVTHHNKFLEQIRSSFVSGAYYPALTAACALGERILNRLILAVRVHFQNTRQYRSPDVRNGEPISDWQRMIGILQAWRILRPAAADELKVLKVARNRALHFNPDVDEKVRDLALAACRSLCRVVEIQYAPIGPMPWYMEGTPGACFVKKESEAHPFVREIIIPCCAYVGPLSYLRPDPETQIWSVHDTEYPQEDVTDEEFAEMFRNRRSTRGQNGGNDLPNCAARPSQS